MGLLRVFYAPEKLFAQLKPKGAWVLPLIASLVLALTASLVVVNWVGMETITRAQIERNPRTVQQLGQDKVDEIVRNSDTPVRRMLAYTMAVVSTAVVILLVAGILTGLLQLVGQGASYSRVVAVFSYSHFAYSLVLVAMSILILAMMPDYTNMDFQNIVRLNPTLFLDQATTSKPLYSILSSLDLLSFWAIFLVALGLSKITEKLRLSTALMIVLAPWAVYVLGKAGLAMLF